MQTDFLTPFMVLIHFQIPQQSLLETLEIICYKTEAYLEGCMFDPSSAGRYVSAPLNGDYTINQALTLVLARSSLSYDIFKAQHGGKILVIGELECDPDDPQPITSLPGCEPVALSQ